MVSKSQQIKASPDIIYSVFGPDSANAKLPVLNSASLFVEFFYLFCFMYFGSSPTWQVLCNVKERLVLTVITVLSVPHL